MCAIVAMPRVFDVAAQMVTGACCRDGPFERTHTHTGWGSPHPAQFCAKQHHAETARF
jgi:hypothetical protein